MGRVPGMPEPSATAVLPSALGRYGRNVSTGLTAWQAESVEGRVVGQS